MGTRKKRHCAGRRTASAAAIHLLHVQLCCSVLCVSPPWYQFWESVSRSVRKSSRKHVVLLYSMVSYLFFYTCTGLMRSYYVNRVYVQFSSSLTSPSLDVPPFVTLCAPGKGTPCLCGCTLCSSCAAALGARLGTWQYRLTFWGLLRDARRMLKHAIWVSLNFHATRRQKLEDERKVDKACAGNYCTFALCSVGSRNI